MFHSNRYLVTYKYASISFLLYNDNNCNGQQQTIQTGPNYCINNGNEYLRFILQSPANPSRTIFNASPFSILIKFSWSNWWVLLLEFPKSFSLNKCSVFDITSYFDISLYFFIFSLKRLFTVHWSALGNKVSDGNIVHIQDWRMLTLEMPSARRAHKHPVTIRMFSLNYMWNVNAEYWSIKLSGTCNVLKSKYHRIHTLGYIYQKK